MTDVGGINIKARRYGVTLEHCKHILPFIEAGNECHLMMITRDERRIKHYQAIFKSLGIELVYEEKINRLPRTKMHFDERGLELVWIDHWIEDRFVGYLIKKA